LATAAQWVEGARPRTLPAATAPVLAGSGAAALVDGFVWWRAALALVVALALQVGVNYANDYSDGVRGTDAARVGPLRLVGSGVAAPSAVKAAAWASFGVAAFAGLLLCAVSSWWLLLVGAVAIVAAWFYTGGSSPYGYRALGEVSVFVFFGLVATVGTTYVQARSVPVAAWLAGVGCGAFACAILVANNLRDAGTDGQVGKRTLAVLLGDTRTRSLWVVLVCVPYLTAVVTASRHPLVLVVLVTVVLVVPPARVVRSGAVGRDLIAVLRATGLALLAYGAVLGLTLALS
jgi:1,4-dihydroxy-2-naphthoate polyprenyltransferase